MPKVPANNVLPFPTPQVADADLLMAAAIMDEQGRLFEPEEEMEDEPINPPLP